MQSPFLILCPLRSFSSLVCGMLGQHPDLYGMPELNLFQHDTLGPLMQLHHKRRPHGAHGLLRALAQLHDGEQTVETVERAKAWVREHAHWSTRQVFVHLAELVAPRIIIDKSPATVMSPKFLNRAIAMFPDASFLHLTRHPRSTGKSIIDLVSRNDEWDGPVDPENIDPERIWRVSHGNVKRFCNSLPEGQCMRLRGEDLLSELDTYLPQICEWLGIRDDAEAIEAMKHPETSPYACIGPDNSKYGNDPNFLNSPVFRPGRVSEPQLAGDMDWAPGKPFPAPIVKLAKEFGYR